MYAIRSYYAKRNIDQDIGGAGSDLLGKYRGNQLPLAIQVERPFDADQQLVGRAEVDLAAPGQASIGGIV